MSLYFFEGFDDDSADRLDGTANDGFQSGRWSGSRAVQTIPRNTDLYVDLPNPTEQLIVGFAVRASQTISSGYPWRFFQLRPNDDGDFIYFEAPSGSAGTELRLCKGPGFTSGETLATVPGVWPGGREWIWIELDIAWGVDAAVMIRCEEIVVYSDTLDTTSSGGTGWDRVGYADYSNQFSSGYNVAYDDLYIIIPDETEPNTFLGDVRAILVSPASDGSTTDWTPSTGTDNYAMVADPSAETYVETNTAGDVDLYGFASLPELPETHPRIYGVTLGAVAGKTDVTTRKLRGVADNGTTQEVSDDHELGELAGVRIVWPQDPFTESEWQKEDIDSYEFGFEARP